MMKYQSQEALKSKTKHAAEDGQTLVEMCEHPYIICRWGSPKPRSFVRRTTVSAFFVVLGGCDFSIAPRVRCFFLLLPGRAFCFPLPETGKPDLKSSGSSRSMRMVSPRLI